MKGELKMSDNSNINLEKSRINIATLILFLINITVFILMSILSNTRGILLLDPNNVIQAPWTLITVFFAQENFLHLIVNMALLLIFGKELEKTIGGKHVFLIYFISGFLGSLVVIPFAGITNWTGQIAGASAAIFGITAAFAAINPEKIILKGKMKQWALSLFIINILIYFINPDVSIGAPAHAIGIILGYLYGLWLKRNNSYLNESKE